MGAVVTAVGRSENKAGDAERLGASAFLPQGHLPDCAFDVILNTVSAPVDVAALLRALVPGGKLITVGMPGQKGGQSLELSVALLSLVPKGRSLIGSQYGGRAAILRMLAFCAAKGIRPVTEEMPLAKINDAVAKLEAGQARYRIVLNTTQI